MASISKYILLIFLLGACSQQRYHKGANGEFIFPSKEDAVLAFMTTSLTCQDINDCPDNVGSLTGYNEKDGDWSVSACSMTLVAPDVVLTNRHCLPSTIKTKGADCSAAVQINFPKTLNFEEEKLACDKVLDLSAEYTPKGQHPDWALLKTKKSTKRLPVVTDLAGVPVNKAVKIYPAYTELNVVMDMFYSPKGEIRPMTCVPDYKMQITSFFYHPLSALFAVDECSIDVVHGNSGSGMRSLDGKLIGLLSAMIVPVNATKEASREAFGTNVACIPYFNSSPSEFCHYDETPKFFEEVKLIKGYVLFNQERYFNVPETEMRSRSVYVRPGAGLVFKNLIEFGEEERAQFPFIASRREVLDYFSEQLGSALFMDTASCVEKNAPDKFMALLPYNNLFSSNFDNFDLKFYVAPTLIGFQFIKTGDKYKASISLPELSSEDKAIVTRQVETQSLCRGGDKASCTAYIDLIKQMETIPEERSAKINTYLFLEGHASMTTDLPICR
jgi:hypothetical protein